MQASEFIDAVKNWLQSSQVGDVLNLLIEGL